MGASLYPPRDIKHVQSWVAPQHTSAPQPNEHLKPKKDLNNLPFALVPPVFVPRPSAPAPLALLPQEAKFCTPLLGVGRGKGAPGQLTHAPGEGWMLSTGSGHHSILLNHSQAGFYMSTTGAPLNPPRHLLFSSTPICVTKVSLMAALALFPVLPWGAGSTIPSILSWHTSATTSRCWGGGGALPPPGWGCIFVPSLQSWSHFKPHQPRRSLARAHIGPCVSVAL